MKQRNTMSLCAAILAILAFLVTGVAQAQVQNMLVEVLDDQGVGLNFTEAGVGLVNIQQPGQEIQFISLEVPDNIISATLYWTGRQRPCENVNSNQPCNAPVEPYRDQEIFFDGTKLTTPAGAGEILAIVNGYESQLPDGSFIINVGYKADVTSLVQARSGQSYMFPIEDADTSFDFMQDFTGAGLFVLYTDPNDTQSYRVIVYDGLDFAYGQNDQNDHAQVTEPITFNFDSTPLARMADLVLFTGDTTFERPDRIDVTVPGEPVLQLVNQLTGTDGEAHDTVVLEIDIPAGAESATVQLFSAPFEGTPAPDSLLWVLGALRIPLGGADIDIRKEAEGEDVRTFAAGSDVTFEIEVENTGSEDLTGVEVDDPSATDCSQLIGDLASGATHPAYDCTVLDVQDSFINEACVTADGGLEDCDPSTVEIIDIDIRKEAEGDDSRTFAAGSDVDFEIVVTNTGPEDLTGVDVTDLLVPGCEQFIGDLAAGASETINCTVFNVTDAFDNEACVEGTRNGVTVEDCDSSEVLLSGIDIRKEAEGADVRVFASGASVTFQIAVENTGGTDLTGVVVTDTDAPGCAKNIGDLAAGATETYDCTIDNVQTGFNNEACVEGTLNETTVGDCDTSEVQIIDIDIRKQAEGADSRTIAPGSDVTFEIAVTNTGELDLTNVQVTDVLVSSCNMTFPTLTVGQTQTYVCSAQGVVLGFVNEVCVTGERDGVQVGDCDPSTVDLAGIDIRKQAEGPDMRAFMSGETVTFEIVVTNTGQGPLSGVTVSDPLAPGCDLSIGNLGGGESETYTCDVVNVTEGFVNEACVEGMSNGVTVDDCDPSTVEIISIDIRKQAEGEDSRTFGSGSEVFFEIAVKNTGDEDLTEVVVTDPLAPDCVEVIGTLNAGSTYSYFCSLANVTADLTNEACVAGMREGVEVSDCDPSTVDIIDIDIRKEVEGPDLRIIERGDSVSYEIFVTNNGPNDLENVAVTDLLVPDCNMNIGPLVSGDTRGYFCSTLAGVFNGFENVACVAGSRDGVTVEDCDSSSVEVAAIDIRKQAEGPDSRAVIGGSDVTYEIVVTNTGEQRLFEIVVSDIQAPGCARDIDSLVPGASFSYTCTVPALLAGFENEACVNAVTKRTQASFFHPDLAPAISLNAGPRPLQDMLRPLEIVRVFNTNVDDCDTSTVEVVSIDIRKQLEGPDSRTFQAGANVTFDIVVTNTGDLNLHDVVVSDDGLPHCDRVIGPLAPGAANSVTYSCTAVTVVEGFVNEACVSANRDGITVGDCDPSTVEIVDIDIRKQDDGADVRTFASGSDVTFEIVVTNTGEQDLFGVLVSDPLSTDCGRTIESLLAGSSIAYLCTEPAVTATFDNEVCVNASRDGVALQDCDTSTVEIIDIDIRKQIEGPDTRVVPNGSDVTFEIVVTNTGDADLSGVQVTDLLTPDCDYITSAPLAPGDSVIYTCEAPNVTDSFENEACVVGSRNGASVDDCDPSTVEIASIDIRKQAEGDDVRTFPNGSDVTFEIVVTNTSDQDLSQVAVSDPLTPDCDRTIGTLLAGSSISYFCTAPSVSAGFVNQICVDGTRGGLDLQDCDTSEVEIIDIDIRKQAEGPDSRTVFGGSDVTFEIVVTNTGDEDLTGVEVTDLLSPSCNNTIGFLAAGANETYSCTVFNLMNSFNNEACVSGSRNGVTVGDCDPSFVEVLPLVCDLEVEKTCQVPLLEDLECDDKIAAMTLRYIGPTILGASVGFEGGGNAVSFYNNVDLISGVTILTAQNGFTIDAAFNGEDDLGSNMDYFINNLKEEIHTSCSKPFVAGQPAPLGDGSPSPHWFVENFRDKNGNFVTIEMGQPASECTISGIGGTEVTYHYVITNNGDALSGVTAVDDKLDIGAGVFSLAAGEERTFTVMADINSTTVNTVTVSGQLLSNELCTAADSATVIVNLPPFTCDKPIEELTMIWDGGQAVRVKAWKGSVGGTLLADIPSVPVGGEISVDGYSGSPNDVFWEVFVANSSSKIGESKFHLSCSDDEMDGEEDCGKRQGNGKSNDSGFLNDWLLEGMVDQSGAFDCN